jgi:hypothetical protein
VYQKDTTLFDAEGTELADHRGAAHLIPSGLPLLHIVSFASGTLASPAINDFPDAGPGGPDSLLAGVGRGIPFGLFGLPDQAFGLPYTGAHVLVTRSNIAAAMRAAEAAHTRLVMSLAGASSHYTNPDGTFNLELWKARVDTYRDVDFAPYVTEGLILAHFLVYLDIAWAQWAGPFGGSGGRTPEEFRDENVAQAKAQGLRLCSA